MVRLKNLHFKVSIEHGTWGEYVEIKKIMEAIFVASKIVRDVTLTCTELEEEVI